MKNIPPALQQFIQIGAILLLSGVAIRQCSRTSDVQQQVDQLLVINKKLTLERDAANRSAAQAKYRLLTLQQDIQTHVQSIPAGDLPAVFRSQLDKLRQRAAPDSLR